MTDDDIIKAIVKREGDAYTDNPNDPGGPTKYGITMATLEAHRQVPTTPSDVRLLTEDEAEAIYRFRYIEQPGFDHVGSVDVRSLVVDSAVQHGVLEAGILLQRAAGVTPEDGRVGPDTLAVVNKTDPVLLYAQLWARRLGYYAAIMQARPHLIDFAGGWLNRMIGLVEARPR